MHLVYFYYKNISDLSCPLFGVSHSSYEERDIAVLFWDESTSNECTLHFFRTVCLFVSLLVTRPGRIMVSNRLGRININNIT